MIPRWFRLLHCYRAHTGGYAPTGPFILGSLRMPIGAIINDPQPCRSELGLLLQDMLDRAPDSFSLRLSRCDRLRQPIVAPFKAPYRPHGVPLRSEVQDRDTLFVDPEFVRQIPGLQGVSERLWHELGVVICEGRFSFENGSYNRFNKKDERFIRECLNYEYNFARDS